MALTNLGSSIAERLVRAGLSGLRRLRRPEADPHLPQQRAAGVRGGSERRCAKPIRSYQVYKGTVFDLVDQAVDVVLSEIRTQERVVRCSATRSDPMYLY